MTKVEDFINCIFEKEEGWSFSYYKQEVHLTYVKNDTTVSIYPFPKYVKYENFLGKYFGLGEDDMFYKYSIKISGKGSQNFEPKDIYKFRDKVCRKIQQIEFQRTLRKLKKRKSLIDNLKC